MGGQVGNPPPGAPGYQPTGDEVIGNPPLAAPPASPPANPPAARARAEHAPGDAFHGDAPPPPPPPTTAGSTPALSRPPPQRLQDIAARTGDTGMVGPEVDRGFWQSLLDIIVEFFSLGQHDTRLGNTYTTADREGFAEQGREFGRRAYNSGNGAQLEHFIVRDRGNRPEMQGDPPRVVVAPRLREAVEAEVRQAFTDPATGQLTITDQAVRIRVDAMLRGIRDEMTARLNGTTTGPASGAPGTPAVQNATFTPTVATVTPRDLHTDPRGELELSTFTDPAQLTAYIEHAPRRGAGGDYDLTRPGLGGMSATQLGALHDRAASLNFDDAAHIPTAAQATEIRTKYAAMNAALASGDFTRAHALATELGLPMSEAVMINMDQMSDVQYRTAMALGLCSYTIRDLGNNQYESHNGWRDDIAATRHGQRQFVIPSGLTASLNQPASYAALIDAMQTAGVTPLSAPPSQDQILQYLDHVQQMNRARPPAEQQAALLNANQLVMSGLQIHYRAASGNDPTYGRHGADEGVFVTRNGNIVMGDNGQPLRFPLPASMSDADKRTLLGLGASAAIPAGGDAQYQAWFHAQTPHDRRGLSYIQARDESPDSFTDNSSRPVYAQAWESDCEGMASFRLRTLPPGFSPVGVVTGGPTSGSIGHVIALYRGPDGTMYLSSNGEEPRPVADLDHDGHIDASELRRAVLTEFARIYHRGLGDAGNIAVADPENLSSTDLDNIERQFRFGLGAPPSPMPAAVAAGSRADQLNWQANEMLRTAGEQEILRVNTRGMPDQDWSTLVPAP